MNSQRGRGEDLEERQFSMFSALSAATKLRAFENRYRLHCALDLDHSVVIRDATFGIADATFDKRVALRPMNLDVAGGDRRNAAAAAQDACLATNDNRVAVLQ